MQLSAAQRAQDVKDCTDVSVWRFTLLDEILEVDGVLHLKLTSNLPNHPVTLFVPQRGSRCCEVPLLTCIHLSFPSLHLLLSLHSDFALPAFLTFSLYIYHSLYLCLPSLCVCIDFVAVHALCFSPFLIEGVRWSLKLPNEIKVPLFSLLPRFFPSFHCNKRKLHWLWTWVCEMSSLCSDCQPIFVPSLLFSAPHLAFFLTSQIYFSLTLITYSNSGLLHTYHTVKQIICVQA